MHVNFKPMGGDLVGGLPNPAASMLQAQIFGPKSPFNEYLNAKSLTNKTLNACIAKGTWTASGTWTLPAATFSGPITINNTLSTGQTTVAPGGGTQPVIIGKAGTGAYSFVTLNNDLAINTGLGMFGADSGDPNTLYLQAPTTVSQRVGATIVTNANSSGFSVTGVTNTSGYTVATLPSGTLGMRAYVTDALAPTYNAVLVGGGVIKVPAFYNGTAWVSA